MNIFTILINDLQDKSSFASNEMSNLK
jgi:hypothetical protein